MRFLALAVMLAASMSAQESTVVACTGKVLRIQTRYAMADAVKIFATIGVTLQWRVGDDCPADSKAIQIRFSDVVEREDLDHFALAKARPFEGIHVVVYYQRVNLLAPPAHLHKVLAYVLVHEITHILQGVDRHAPSGIMKANWSDFDVSLMRTKGLTFTPGDIELVRLGLSARQHRRETLLAVGR